VKLLLAILLFVVFTGGAAFGLGATAAALGYDPWWGAGLGIAVGLSLGAGLVWGARAARARARKAAGPTRLQRLGQRAADGERGPDGNALPLPARTAVGLTESDRRQHLPGAYLSYVRAAGEGLQDGASTAWEVNYFSPRARRLLRIQVARDGAQYQITTDADNIGWWLDTMATDQQAAAWEGIQMRHLEAPPNYADSPTVIGAVAAAAHAARGEATALRVRQMTVAMARPTLEWAPTVFWITEVEDEGEAFRYYSDIQTAEVLRREKVA
jgi:hypothetical protein